MMKKIGYWAYMLGLVGVVGAGIGTGLGWFELGTVGAIVMLVLGILIGLLNITQKEYIAVMVAGLVIGASSLGLSFLPVLGTVLEAILQNVALLVLPATIVVALRVVYEKYN